jgi:hypothetical protein
MPDLEAAKPATPHGRPFPWFCPRCRRKEVRPATIAYRCVRTCQGRDYAVEIPALLVPQCGNCKEVVFNYSAEEQIAKALEDMAGRSENGQGGGETGAAPCRPQSDHAASAGAPEAPPETEKTIL